MEPKYKIPLNLRGSVSPEATLYVEQEDLNAAVATKLEELENRIENIKQCICEDICVEPKKVSAPFNQTTKPVKKTTKKRSK